MALGVFLKGLKQGEEPGEEGGEPGEEALGPASVRTRKGQASTPPPRMLGAGRGSLKCAGTSSRRGTAEGSSEALVPGGQASVPSEV